MKSNDGTTYIATSIYEHWSFLNGYSCNSKSIDHFLRHLAYRFSRYCTMYEINTAYEVHDILVNTVEDLAIECEQSGNVKSFHVENRYYDEYGYVLELNIGDFKYPEIKKMFFSSEMEADEWLSSQK